MHATGSVSVAVCSDLHVDTWPDHPLDWAALASEQPADVLLVAGDVHDDQGGTAAELLRAAQVRRAAQRLEALRAHRRCSALPHVAYLAAL